MLDGGAEARAGGPGAQRGPCRQPGSRRGGLGSSPGMEVAWTSGSSRPKSPGPGLRARRDCCQQGTYDALSCVLGLGYPTLWSWVWFQGFGHRIWRVSFWDSELSALGKVWLEARSRGSDLHLVTLGQFSGQSEASSPVITLPVARAPGPSKAPPRLRVQGPGRPWRAVWVPPGSILKGLLAKVCIYAAKLASLRRNFGSFVGDRVQDAPVQDGRFSACPSVLHSADTGLWNLLGVCVCV